MVEAFAALRLPLQYRQRQFIKNRIDEYFLILAGRNNRLNNAAPAN
jgi:hypothetical protein